MPLQGEYILSFVSSRFVNYVSLTKGTFEILPLKCGDCSTGTINTGIYYIDTNEIPGELSRENMISSQVKIP